MSGQDQGPGALFEQFLAWKQAQDAAAADDGQDVPLFEKTADGAERSATLPWRHARPLLESWGWVQPEGATADGNSDGGQDGAGSARGFFQQITGGGGKASGPAPASGQRAPRKATG